MKKLTYLRSKHADKMVSAFGKGGWIRFLLRTITHENFLYYAPVSSLGVDGLVGGLKDEGENIQKNVMSVDEALEMVRVGEIDDAKTILALLWLKDQRKK